MSARYVERRCWDRKLRVRFRVAPTAAPTPESALLQVFLPHDAGTEALHYVNVFPALPPVRDFGIEDACVTYDMDADEALCDTPALELVRDCFPMSGKHVTGFCWLAGGAWRPRVEVLEYVSEPIPAHVVTLVMARAAVLAGRASCQVYPLVWLCGTAPLWAVQRVCALLG